MWSLEKENDHFVYFVSATNPKRKYVLVKNRNKKKDARKWCPKKATTQTKFTEVKIMRAIQKHNRNLAYAKLNISRKQFENCIKPLWELGQATAFEAAEYLNVPINEVGGRFTECFDKGLIAVHPKVPVKINKRSGRGNTNYILTAKGKKTYSQALLITKEEL